MSFLLLIYHSRIDNNKLIYRCNLNHPSRAQKSKLLIKTRPPIHPQKTRCLAISILFLDFILHIHVNICKMYYGIPPFHPTEKSRLLKPKLHLLPQQTTLVCLKHFSIKDDIINYFTTTMVYDEFLKNMLLNLLPFTPEGKW